MLAEFLSDLMLYSPGSGTEQVLNKYVWDELKNE